MRAVKYIWTTGPSTCWSVLSSRCGLKATDSGSPSRVASTVNGVNTQETVEGARSESGQPRRLPYDDAFSVVTHLHLKMEQEVFVEGARVWLRILRDQHPAEYSALLQELSQQEHQSA